MTQQTWTHPFPEVTIIDFTMDPAQDLLVIVSLAPPEYVPSSPLGASTVLVDRTTTPQIKAYLPDASANSIFESAAP